MKPTSLKPVADEPTGLFAGWTRFWFSPSQPLGLHVVRVLTCVLLVAWLLPFAGDVSNQFSDSGWFDLKAVKEAGNLERLAEQDRLAGRMENARVGPPKPVRGWSLLYVVWANPTLLQAFFWGSVAVFVLFAAGVATRLTAVLTWLIVASITASPAFENDLDAMLQMLTFYLAVGYLLLGQWTWKLSWLDRVLGPLDGSLLGRLFRRESEVRTSMAANVAMRLLQVHFATLLVVSCLHKLQVGDWWAGIAHWSNIYPALTTTMSQVREHASDPMSLLVLLNLAAYATLAWQLTFPLFAWRSGWWRVLLLGGAVAGALGLLFLYQMPLFAVAFVIACLAYLGDWAFITERFRRTATKSEVSRQPFPGPHAREVVGAIQTAKER